MKQIDPSIMGRKVFFLNLSVDVKDRIAAVLRDEEYEVYIISDYREVKTALRAYPNSILFVQVDDHEKNELTTNQWFNFLYSFKDDEILNTILLGIISRRMSTADRNFFMLNLPLAAGMLAIRNGTDSVLQSVRDILLINEAKGRRQYVRARCSKDSLDCVECEIDGQTMDLKINDISCAGLSCIISKNKAAFFEPRKLLRGTSIYFEKKPPIRCNCAVFATKPFGDVYSLVVLLILPNTSVNSKNVIRNHVFQLLQKDLDNVIASAPLDEFEYSNEIDKELLKYNVSSPLSEEDVAEFLVEAELEEI